MELFNTRPPKFMTNNYIISAFLFKTGMLQLAPAAVKDKDKENSKGFALPPIRRKSL